jgi:hypothetical protein
MPDTGLCRLGMDANRQRERKRYRDHADAVQSFPEGMSQMATKPKA